MQKICYICKEKFENKYLEDKKNHKVKDHCHPVRMITVKTYINCC